jgi:hypothetical protein
MLKQKELSVLGSSFFMTTKTLHTCFICIMKKKFIQYTKLSVVLSILLMATACSLFKGKVTESPDIESLHPMLSVSQDSADDVYRTLLDSIMENPADGDYQALRFVHSQSSEYAPYSDNEHLEKIKKLLDSEQYVVATEVIKSVYYKQFHIPLFHYYAFVAWKRSGIEDMAKIHSLYYHKLIESITENGDGKTPETAWTVINVSEEYRVLEYLDMELQSQSLITENGMHFDQMEVTDSTGLKQSLYFNIEIPFSHLMQEEDE